jgi:hypothetical protein
MAWSADVAAVQQSSADRTGATPISCWWRSDRAAVRIGEPFGLTLTCRVMENERTTVVPNLSEIEPGSIQLTPFEVVDGARHEDIVMPPWRYLQYTYTLRLLGEEFFGRDVPIPAANVRFRVQTGGNEAIEGNEQTYVLPAIPLRILSLLPAQAADIRDPLAGTFVDVEARRFRATMEMVAGVILLGFAGVLLIAAGVRGVERLRSRTPSVEARVPDAAVLGRCLREIERVRSDATRDGWSPDLAARALAPLRVAGAIALSRPVAQARAGSGETPREGQLAVRHGVLGRRRVFVSASITGDAIDRLRTASNGARPPDVDSQFVDAIRDALAGLNAVRYGRNGADTDELDRRLEAGSDALRRLRTARRWPARIAGMATWRR